MYVYMYICMYVLIVCNSKQQIICVRDILLLLLYMRLSSSQLI